MKTMGIIEPLHRTRVQAGCMQAISFLHSHVLNPGCAGLRCVCVCVCVPCSPTITIKGAGNVAYPLALPARVLGWFVAAMVGAVSCTVSHACGVVYHAVCAALCMRYVCVVLPPFLTPTTSRHFGELCSCLCVCVCVCVCVC